MQAWKPSTSRDLRNLCPTCFLCSWNGEAWCLAAVRVYINMRRQCSIIKSLFCPNTKKYPDIIFIHGGNDIVNREGVVLKERTDLEHHVICPIRRLFCHVSFICWWRSPWLLSPSLTPPQSLCVHNLDEIIISRELISVFCALSELGHQNFCSSNPLSGYFLSCCNITLQGGCFHLWVLPKTCMHSWWSYHMLRAHFCILCTVWTWPCYAVTGILAFMVAYIFQYDSCAVMLGFL